MSSNVTYVREAQASALIQQRQRATLKGTDAWGKRAEWTIEWQADTVEADEVQANIGNIGVVWADWCPVSLRTVRGGLVLTALPFSVTGTTQIVMQAAEVESEDDMAPGCWRIVVTAADQLSGLAAEWRETQEAESAAREALAQMARIARDEGTSAYRIGQLTGAASDTVAKWLRG